MEGLEKSKHSTQPKRTGQDLPGPQAKPSSAETWPRERPLQLPQLPGPLDTL